MTEEEFRTGKGPAFEDSRKAAEAIGADADALVVNGDIAVFSDFDYIAEARQTLSSSWHGDKVSKANFVRILNTAIDAANQLDKVKKTLFYGRDNNLDPALGQMNLRGLPAMLGENSPEAFELNADIIHAIIGIFTEAGELLEAMREAINQGKPFDMVNLKEETGDAFWYQAILAYRAGFTFDDAQRVNIAKLRARFPNRFVEYDANNRNLAAERAILEGGVGNHRTYEEPRDIAEQSLPVNHRSRRMEGERSQDGKAIEAQKPTI